MSKILVSHLSVADWPEPVQWKIYFEQTQQLLGGPLTHLDENDPVRRKVTSLDDAGDFMCAFKDQEQSRWVFGRFKTLGIELSIERFRPGAHQFANALTWFFPASFVEKVENQQRLKSLFDLGNRTFKPFYAYSDDVAQIASKKKPSGSVDIQAELLGVFWVTYFNAAYVAFFGKEKFQDFLGVEHSSDGSITIVLGDSPKSVANDLREQAAATLGKQSFVNPKDILGKPPGRFALTFQQLLAEERKR
jgi:hypothetical protein